MIRITVKTRPKTPWRFDAWLDGEPLVTSDQPMVDAARALINLGWDPDTPATMRHEGALFDSFAPMPLGEWAKWTYWESERGMLTKARWKPKPSVAGPA